MWLYLETHQVIVFLNLLVIEQEGTLNTALMGKCDSIYCMTLLHSPPASCNWSTLVDLPRVQVHLLQSHNNDKQ